MEAEETRIRARTIRKICDQLKAGLISGLHRYKTDLRRQNESIPIDQYISFD